MSELLSQSYTGDSQVNGVSLSRTVSNGGYQESEADTLDTKDLDEFLDLDHQDNSYMGLSEASCSYCGLDSMNSVIKCDTCDKWFCNSKNGSGSSSHIVTHLTLSRHNCVSLHKDSDLGDTKLECYNCGKQNVFNLGYISAIQDQVVVILCRLPCSQLKDSNWDSNNWNPIIELKQFLPWISAIPSEDELITARTINYQHIMKLENEWRLNRDTNIDDIATAENTEDVEEEVLPLLMRYSDAFQYQRAFAPLINLESEFDRQLKESQASEHIQVQWSLGLNNKHLASFGLSSYENSGLRVAVGDEMILKFIGLQYAGWEGRGHIIRLPDAQQEYFTLELNNSSIKPPVDVSSGFTAEFVWKGTTYERMQDALKTFALDEKSVSSFIYHKILGHDVKSIEFDINLPKELSIPKFAELNSSQLNAVRTVLKRPLTLIQGPPGTGKTVTSATIVYHLNSLSKGQKILVCAPSNVAVDHLTSKLHALKLNVIRLTARSREDIESSVESLTLHAKVNSKAKGKLKSLIRLKTELGELSSKDSGLYMKLLREQETKILDQADIICCTCVGAGDKRLSKYNFRTILIDESSQATEPEMLIPIVKGARQVILVGDHQQLGPVVLDKRAGNAGLRQSLFERLIILGHVPIRLEVQYRMNPRLSEFASNMFYEGSLQDGVTIEDRLIENSTFPWPVHNVPMMFWGNFGKEEISSSGLSFLNRVEAMNVEKIITRLFKDGIKADQIGVITPYEGQRAFILQYLTMNGTLIEKKEEYLSIEVVSVDAFQGREKDFIILSCVRANDTSIGFLRDPRRLNVALTRAKYGMVILGNFNSLSKNYLWNQLLIHYREQGCLVEGTLENLQTSMFQLTNSKQTNFKNSSNKDMLNSITNGEQQSNKTISTDNMWPELGKQHHTNFYNNLSKLDQDYNDRQQKQINYQQEEEDDIKSIASSFAAGFNLG